MNDLDASVAFPSAMTADKLLLPVSGWRVVRCSWICRRSW